MPTTEDLLETLRRALGALHAARAEYALAGGVALAIHGIYRQTSWLDGLIRPADVERTASAVRRARLRVDDPRGARFAFALDDLGGYVILQRAESDVTREICARAEERRAFGGRARVATLEQLAVLAHLPADPEPYAEDLALIVRSKRVDLGAAERLLARFHPELVKSFQQRVKAAQVPLRPRKNRFQRYLSGQEGSRGSRSKASL